MFQTYLLGYGLSLLCTGTAFTLVAQYLNSGHTFPTHAFLLPVLVVLAVGQLVVQLVFFLHFGKESKPWNRFVFAFMLLIVICIVGGSFWIMSNLQHNQAPGNFLNGDISAQNELD